MTNLRRVVAALLALGALLLIGWLAAPQILPISY